VSMETRNRIPKSPQRKKSNSPKWGSSHKKRNHKSERDEMKQTESFQKSPEGVEGRQGGKGPKKKRNKKGSLERKKNRRGDRPFLTRQTVGKESLQAKR